MSELDQPMGNTELRLTLNTIQGKLDEVITHTTHTNGSIADAQIEIARLKNWRTGLTYAWALFILCMVPILGLTLYKVWYSDSEEHQEYLVEQGVQQALLNYQETNIK